MKWIEWGRIWISVHDFPWCQNFSLIFRKTSEMSVAIILSQIATWLLQFRILLCFYPLWNENFCACQHAIIPGCSIDGEIWRGSVMACGAAIHIMESVPKVSTGFINCWSRVYPTVRPYKPSGPMQPSPWDRNYIFSSLQLDFMETATWTKLHYHSSKGGPSCGRLNWSYLPPLVQTEHKYPK